LPFGYRSESLRTRSIEPSAGASAQLLKIDIQSLHQIADAIIGLIGLRHELRDSCAYHDFAIGGIEACQVEMLQHIREFLLECLGQIAAHRDRIGWNRIGLPQENQVPVFVMAALRRRFELLAVQFAGIDLVIIDGLERGRVAAGIDRLSGSRPPLRSP